MFRVIRLSLICAALSTQASLWAADPFDGLKPGESRILSPSVEMNKLIPAKLKLELIPFHKGNVNPSEVLLKDPSSDRLWLVTPGGNVTMIMRREKTSAPPARTKRPVRKTARDWLKDSALSTPRLEGSTP